MTEFNGDLSNKQLLSNVKSMMSAVKLLKRKESCEIRVAKNLQSLQIKKIEGFDEHFLNLNISQNGYWNVGEHSLPDKLIFKEPNTVEGYMDDFHKFLDALVLFYTNLSSLDYECCVIEPHGPTTKDCFRIVKLEERVFLKIEIDPVFANEVSTSLIGPNVLISKLMRDRNELETDDEGEGEQVEGRRFLRQIATQMGRSFFLEREEGMATEKPCAVCLEYRDDAGLASIFSCESLACEARYHRRCLKEYLKRQINKNTLCTVTSAICPNFMCSSKIEIDFHE